MEGGALLGFESDVNSGVHTSDLHVGFDEATSCAPTLRVLKQLIQRCLANAVTSGNVYADALLQHLYRWLCRLPSLVSYNSCFVSYNYCCPSYKKNYCFPLYWLYLLVFDPKAVSHLLLNLPLVFTHILVGSFIMQPPV